jgi:phenylalanyl-tRNA synthetase alpha chain
VIGDLQGVAWSVTTWILAVTWAMFVIDYIVRLSLAENRGSWFRHHLGALAFALVPVLRLVQLLRVLTRVPALRGTAGAALRTKIIIYSGGVSVVLVYIASLAVLEAERDERVLAEERVDVTLPWDRTPRGARHPLTTLTDRIADIFVGMGYEVAEGPELEAEWLNFDALNIGRDHPARTMMDTFFIAGGPGSDEDSGLVLRTHTSPVQARTMLARTPPIYVVAPGRVYRRDTIDATHFPIFHQFEGLAIDKGITMADLKGTLLYVMRQLYGPERQVRFRTHYFPFTEPSMEPDVSCFACGGAGCPVCKHSGWIEMGGSGMVDPYLYEFVGWGPEEYTGFAFGMGIERTAQLRHGIPGVRPFWDDDLRLLRQF